jgi:DNA-binding NarL/FixJ family response regulator
MNLAVHCADARAARASGVAPDARVERARIALVELPRIMREIIERAVADQPDMEIVGELPASTLPEALDGAGVDVVISGTNYDCASLRELLDERPRLKVLAVADDGRDAFLFELRPTRTRLGEVSPQTIVDAIRNARCATTS